MSHSERFLPTNRASVGSPQPADGARAKNIVMVISSLSGGGAERVLVLLARGLQALGHRVRVVTIFGEDQDFYRLPEGVERVALDLGRTTLTLVEKLKANAKRISALRGAIRRAQPDAVISFMTETNVLALLAARRLQVPVIVTEHADPRKKRLPRIWKLLRRLWYRSACRVVSVSAGVDAYFHWLPAGKRAVIPNPICPDELAAAGGEALAWDWPHAAAAMGRLEVEKGFDLLIHAFARIAGDFPQWGLVILGEGTRRRELKSLIEDLGLADRSRLAGAVQNPYAVLRKADLFVLPSRSEGFGNALIEAMACGLPVVAANCWSEPPGIVRHDVDGILVPPEDPGALAAAMANLMADPQKREALGSKAAQSAQRYHLEPISQTWDDLLREVCRP